MNVRQREPEDGSNGDDFQRPAKRSRTGCPECRRRKIKCDEVQPQCGHCQKMRLNCNLLDRLFKQSGYSFESSSNETASIMRLRNSAQEQQDRNDSTSAPAPHHTEWYGFPTTSPGQVRTVKSITNLMSPHAQLPQNLSNTQATHESPTAADTGIPVGYSPGFDIASTSSYRMTPQLESRPHTAHTPDATSPGQASTVSSSMIGSSRDQLEIEYFIRLFFEHAGLWMDLFNKDLIFTKRIAALAKSHRLIRYSICAVAAKRLGQIEDFQTQIGRSLGQKSFAKNLINKPEMDFNWYGAKYYEKAIQLIAQKISQHSPDEHFTSPTALYDSTPGIESHNPRITLLAACILALYEMLSATVSISAWKGHLSGVHRLLRLIIEGGDIGAAQSDPLRMSIGLDEAVVRAAFWFFVVNDLEESYVTQTTLRIDLQNIGMWQRMGLRFEMGDERSYLEALQMPIDDIDDEERLRVMVYLLANIIDLLAEDNTASSPYNDSLSVGRDRYDRIGRALQAWEACLPPSVVPDQQLLRDLSDVQFQASELFRKELWFREPKDALSLVYYHTSQLLLQASQPIDMSLKNQNDLMKAYHTLQSGLRIHMAAIFGIALGEPQDSVKIRLLQPLFVSGKPLTERTDRLLLVDIIRGLETDLGMMSEYRVEDLIKEWGTSYEALGLLPRVVKRKQQFWD